MPKRTDIQSILIIGAGPIVIGQACEFDYSGTQAVKTLKAEGYRVILVNSNPATIMTDPELADATYIEPITPEFVAKIIEKERPDALLPTMGGQTALNCAKALAENGALKKFNVEMIGASLEAINKAEDRRLFNEAMARIGLAVAKNAVVHTIEEARAVLDFVGLPAIIRPSFTMGGTGGGIAYNKEEFEQIVTSGLDASPTTEVLIDESLLGWKEYEMEVVRDKADNCIIVCSIENVDPMGVHTGDSITVAPALTLTDKEYQIMRDASLATLREIGVDTGGSNVQFAVNPADGRMVVIEMNPRVSRSSALASKATGFPIAKVAAKLAVGYTLDEILNDVVSHSSPRRGETGRGAVISDSLDNSSLRPGLLPNPPPTGEGIRMPASFEPTIDYVVTKIPRFTFEKFPGTNDTLTTAMKSVGEAMAIGRSFPESLQKALRSLETGLTGLNEQPGDLDTLRAKMGVPTPARLLQIAQGLRLGMTVEELHAITKFDPWFLRQLKVITDAEQEIKNAATSSPRRGETGRGAELAATHHYPLQKSVKNAKELRKNLTDAEKLLWETLRAEQLGVKFRKQHPVGQYIADFACLDPKLIVELDGGQHGDEANANKDEKRTEFLKQQGFEVLRFCNNEVLENTEGVLQVICKAVGDRVNSGSPHPNPPPTGEGITVDAFTLLRWKKLGFSDARIAELAGMKMPEVAKLREKLKIHPVYKRVDTCAAEFESSTPYMYSTYEIGNWKLESGKEVPISDFQFLNPACEAEPSDRTKIIILGGGPNRIGQGIEFDYCCVHASYALKAAGYETIMINCNPETVSTDYDTSDRLYFEPLTAEDVIAIAKLEQSRGKLLGVIVQFGGQTPLKLAHALEAAGIPIIGTSPDSIDLAEDRERFQQLLHKLKLRQPKNHICRTVDEVMEQAELIGYPVVVRPSYVLGGRAMAIIHEAGALRKYMVEIVQSFGDGPILIDGYLSDAIEVDVDALADGTDVHVAGIMEHIEEAGIHSGDSACSIPAHSLPKEIIKEIEAQTVALAKALKVVGLMNVQFAVKDGVIYILEVNPRASRTSPFVAKATGVPVAKIAARLMAGEKLKNIPHKAAPTRHVAVKEVVFPFARFPGVDIILGPEMKSTGEAMGIDTDFARAFAKGHLAAGSTLPMEGKVFVSVKDSDKKAVEGTVELLLSMGFEVVATRGTAQYLTDKGYKVTFVNKVREGRPHIVDMMKDGMIRLVINTTEGAKSIADSFDIRRTALLGKIPYSTTLAGSRALVQAIAAYKQGKGLEVRSLQNYFSDSKKTAKAG